MKRIHHKHGVRTLLVLALVSTLLLLAFSATAGATKKSRPFKGSLYGKISIAPDASTPPVLYTVCTAAGDLSHMGKSVLYGRHPTALDFAGKMTLTAANGDTIRIDYYGGGDLPPNIGDWYDLWTVATIVGGTGRFRNVTGDIGLAVSLQFMGLDAPEWPAIFRFTGTIKY
jgi:hypothetical protein